MADPKPKGRPRMYSERMVNLNVSVPVPVLEAIDRLAEAWGCSRGEAFRRVLATSRLKPLGL